MSETLNGSPILAIDSKNKNGTISYIYFWKEVNLTIVNQIPIGKNILLIDTFSNMGDKGEGIVFLCNILNKFKDTVPGVNEKTMVKLYPSAACKESSYEFKPTLNKARYSNNDMNLQRYYTKYGFVMESNTDACSLMQVNIEELLTRCSTRGGFRTVSRKNRRSRRNRSRRSRRSEKNRINKKSRRNI